jgi:hypothetical protein
VNNLSRAAGVILAITLQTMFAPVTASAASATFVSDDTWSVYNADPASAGSATLLGEAQKVCLNASFPIPCPAGATIYGFPNGGWSADLSSIPGAAWIWAPGINAATTPADLQQFFFSKTVSVRAGPYTGSSTSIAADDFAELRVNGRIVGNIGSTSNIQLAGPAQSGLTAFDVSQYLIPGKNTITIRGQNGPYWFSPAGCDPCSYAQNTAGVVFGGALADHPYSVMLLYDSSKAVQTGSVLPIKVQLADANGNNVSASTLHLLSLRRRRSVQRKTWPISRP